MSIIPPTAEPECRECHASSRKMIPIIVEGREEYICISCLKEELEND